MSGPYGVQSTGFVQKSSDDIDTDLKNGLKGVFGAGINLGAQSNFGQHVGLWKSWLLDLWQLGQAIYASQYPDSATGAALIDLCALTGTIPLVPYATTVTGILIGTNGTSVPAGTVLSVTGVSIQFATKATAVIATLPIYTNAHGYVMGDMIQSSGGVWYANGPGTSSSAPTGTSTFTDGALVWSYMGAGSAAVATICSAVSGGQALTGPTPCNDFTLTTINTPVSGLALSSNPPNMSDPSFVLGVALETDAQLRARRLVELRASGNAALEAIRAKVIAVTGVTYCAVLDNPTDTTDVNGTAPHSIQVVVQGGTDSAVATAVFAAKAAGIDTTGTSTSSVTDSQGIAHTIRWTRPTPVPIYVIVNLVKGSTWNTGTGPGLVKAALAAVSYTGGQTVIDSALYPIVFSAGGVADITDIFIGTAPSPASSANVPTTIFQIASISTANVTVNAT